MDSWYPELAITLPIVTKNIYIWQIKFRVTQAGYLYCTIFKYICFFFRNWHCSEIDSACANMVNNISQNVFNIKHIWQSELLQN